MLIKIWYREKRNTLSFAKTVGRILLPMEIREGSSVLVNNLVNKIPKG